jgi:hypothetical protein
LSSAQGLVQAQQAQPRQGQQAQEPGCYQRQGQQVSAEEQAGRRFLSWRGFSLAAWVPDAWTGERSTGSWPVPPKSAEHNPELQPETASFEGREVVVLGPCLRG